MLATGLIVAYGYYFEYFMSKYSGNKFDLYLTNMRFHGPYSHFYSALILCNILGPTTTVVPQGPHQHPGALRDVPRR